MVGLVRYCAAIDILRNVYGESETYDSDSSSDWHSCEGESDCCSTASGFESASGDWPDSDHWDECLKEYL